LPAPHSTFRDYKNRVDAEPPQYSRAPWFLLGAGIPLALLALISALPESSGTVTTPAAPSDQVALAATDTELLPQPHAAESEPSELPEPEPELPGEKLILTVGRGDSLDRLFKRHELSRGDLARIMQLDLARQHLRVIKPGDEIEVRHEQGRLYALSRDVSLTEALSIALGDEDFTAEIVERPLDSETRLAHGVIKSSLFEAAANAGISDRTIMNLAGVFAWDIDFVLDIRQGDEFHLVYEELMRDGESLGEGAILAAEFINQGDSYRAIRYTTPDGRTDYFTPEGRSVRKAFVRAPVAFSRISSNFNPRRRHPKLNTIRAHRGVDYAAPTGTPIKAAGDGKVVFRGTKGGYGKTIILQHGGNISTLYAHMSRFGRPRNGARVRQGEVIGYVGATGLATGPHLHYEYRMNGVHQNPRTVKLPDADPLDAEYMPAFQTTAETLLQQLEAQRSLVAAQTAAGTG
jgi:murein DD-endopeptidase MepM/ murein hydrolase activator NlpD